MKTLFWLLLCSFTFAIADEMQDLNIGEPVPSFTLFNYDGKEISLEKFCGKNAFTVVIFISTECPVSNGYNERMVKLSEKYYESNVKFLGINSNKAESIEDISDHSKKHKFPFPVLKDENNIVADNYAAMVTPEVFVINAKGTLLYHGRIDDSWKKESEVKEKDLENALDALLAKKEPPKSETTARGCSIKRVETEKSNGIKP